MRPVGHRMDNFKAANIAVCVSKNRVASLLLFILTGSSIYTTGQPVPFLQLKAKIPLPNVSGRMDHLGVDIKGKRLFATAFNGHSVEVVDLQANKQVRAISDLAEPQGALYDGSSNRLFVSSSMDGSVKIFDGTTLQMLEIVKLSSDADNLRYDAHSNRVVVGYGGEKFLHGKPVRGQGDGALAFLDSSGNKTVDISLDAHPESFQLESSGMRVFANVPDHKEIQVADVRKHGVLARWPVTSCTDNFPMALDEPHHRLFVACRAPALLLVFDTESGKKVASLPIVEHTDDLFYDARKGRIYVLGEGFIQVLQQKDPDHYGNMGRCSTPAGARTGLFVPEWGRLFVAVPERSTKAAEVLEYETR
jgi:hypothetical protein